MLTAGPESVTAVEADLEAEVRSFGFGDGDARSRRGFRASGWRLASGRSTGATG